MGLVVKGLTFTADGGAERQGREHWCFATHSCMCFCSRRLNLPGFGPEHPNTGERVASTQTKGDAKSERAVSPFQSIVDQILPRTDTREELRPSAQGKMAKDKKKKKKFFLFVQQAQMPNAHPPVPCMYVSQGAYIDGGIAAARVVLEQTIPVRVQHAHAA